MLEEDKYLAELSKIKETSPNIYKFPWIRGMTIVDIRKKMKLGTEHYFKGNYHAALQEYTSIFNAVNEFGSLYLHITETELIALTYALAIVHSHFDSRENIDYANTLFTSLKKSNFPATYFGKAKLLCKYERYDDGKMCCKTALKIIENNVISKKYMWPGTSQIIEETENGKLKECLENLKKTCDAVYLQEKNLNNSFLNVLQSHSLSNNWENIPINASCKFKSCVLNRNIKTTCLLDGYYIIHCTDNCCIYYHSKCWKLIKNTKMLINNQKKFLDKPCLTPDCFGVINLIQMYNKQNELQNELLIENDSDKKHRKHKLEKREERKKLKKQRRKTLSGTFDKSLIEDEPLDVEGTSSNFETTIKENPNILNNFNSELNGITKTKRKDNITSQIKKNEMSWTVLSKDGKMEAFEDFIKNTRTESSERRRNLILNLRKINDLYGPLNADVFFNCACDDDDVTYLIEYGGLEKFIKDNEDYINLGNQKSVKSFTNIKEDSASVLSEYFGSENAVSSLIDQNFYKEIKTEVSKSKSENKVSNTENSSSENEPWKQKYFKITKIHEEEKQVWAKTKVEWKEKFKTLKKKINDYITEISSLRKEIEEVIKRENATEKYCFELKKKFCLEKMTDCIAVAERNIQLLQNRYLSKCSSSKDNIYIVKEISKWQDFIDKCNVIAKTYITDVDRYLDQVSKDNLPVNILKFDIPSPPSNPKNVTDLAMMYECPICFESILSSEEECTPCDHQFHMKCLQNWLKKNSSCPVCRMHILNFEDFPSLTR